MCSIIHSGLCTAVQIDKGVDVNIIMFIPTVIIGTLGGGLGALFTIINLKLARVRRRFLARMQAKWKRNMFRMCEPAVLMVSFVVVGFTSGYVRIWFVLSFIDSYMYHLFNFLEMPLFVCLFMLFSVVSHVLTYVYFCVHSVT